MADYLNIAGRVRTTASDGVAMEAQEVKDLNLNKSQQEVNADVQTELGDRYTKEETYSKEQLDELITTPDVNHVSVVATDATTAVTDILPATGEANNIYRVGNWNGTQYDPTMYALYAWNGSAYVCLAVRSFVGEVYDISVNHPDGQGNPTPYADLTAALGTNGANIPADIRRGGMSIKFIQGTVQSSDNKYVQYRLMSPTWSTTVTNWQGVDNGPTAGSDNLVESGGAYKQYVDTQRQFSADTTNYFSSNYGILMTGFFGNNNSYKHGYLAVETGEKYILKAKDSYSLRIAYATSNEAVGGGQIPIVSGTEIIEVAPTVEYVAVIPEGCSYLLMYNTNGSAATFDIKKVSMPTDVIELYSDDIPTSDAVYSNMIDHIELMSARISTSDVTLVDYQIKEDGTFGSNTSHKHAVIPVSAGDRYIIGKVNGVTVNVLFAFVTSDEAIAGGDIPLVEGTMPISVEQGKDVEAVIPSGCNYLIVTRQRDSVTISRIYKCVSEYVSCSVDSSFKLDVKWNFNTISSIALYIGSLVLVSQKGELLKVTINRSVTISTDQSLYLVDGDLVVYQNSSLPPYYSRKGIMLIMISGGIISNGLLRDYISSQIIHPGYEPSGYRTDYFRYDFPNIHITSIRNRASRVSQSFVSTGRDVSFDFTTDANNPLDTLVFAWNTEYLGLAVVNHNNVTPDQTVLLIVASDGRPVSGLMYDSIEQFFNLQERNGLYRTVYPLLTHDLIRPSDGDFSTNPNFASYSVASTPRFIKVKSGGFKIKCSRNIDSLNVYFYNKDFSYIESKTIQNITANTDVDVITSIYYDYIKIQATTSNAEGVTYDNLVLGVTGYFTEDWDTFNPRPSDSGYHRISVMVNVTNPTCCDEVTQTVQDQRQLLPDYGVICLPPTYKECGEPTRLIIYCHGGNVNYGDNSVRFDSQDLEPDYWLAEGYAIMDVEGNPFNNNDEHFQIPQAMDCYVAAYKWVIEHYNIRRDGIFLGGRSMGGGMTFNLLRCPYSIPVIAACPNAPHGMCAGGTTPAGTLGNRQEFYAIHCGFDIPQGFDWDNGTNAYYKADTDTYTAGSKKKLFYDNWNKLVKNVPIWTLCTDLPVDDESIRELVDNFYVTSSSHPSRRRELWGKLHTISRCPVKLFGCYEDASCPPDDTALLYYKMLTNAAQIAEIRLFHSYKDYSGTGTSAHHYDTQDPALRTTVTTRFGVEMTNVPIVYIEMLQFWRRYEQGN